MESFNYQLIPDILHNTIAKSSTVWSQFTAVHLIRTRANSRVTIPTLILSTATTIRSAPRD